MSAPPSQPPAYYPSSSSPAPSGSSKVPAPDQPPLPHPPPSAGDPIVFHVYKAGGMWSKDDIVTGPDKTTIEYYLVFPQKFFGGGWNLTLRRGGKEGPLVLTITRRTFSPDFVVQFPNGWNTGVVKGSFWSWSHEFEGWGGSQRSRFKWKVDRWGGGSMKCVNRDTKVVVASWNASSWAITKDGSLTIEADYLDQAELILGTGLAMEEWCREQQDGS